MQLRRMVVILLAIIMAFVAQQAWLDIRPSQPVEVVISDGMSSADIARMLRQEGVIRSAFGFRLLARVSGMAGKLQSGQYRFDKPADLWDVLQRLKRGDVELHHITVPEGLRTDEILALLVARTGISLREWRASLKELSGDQEAEGRLLPETYAYRIPLRPGKLLGQMWQANAELVSELMPAWLPASKLLVVASIIEKETSRDNERPLVAAVIRNRLRKSMALQMDPTVIYGLWREDGRFSGNLRKVDMKRDTPWNTYVHKGLPPTPICNPGTASLKAAAHPADADYLYFVADGAGGHEFASTLKEHQKNVQRWLVIERQRKSR